MLEVQDCWSPELGTWFCSFIDNQQLVTKRGQFNKRLAIKLFTLYAPEIFDPAEEETYTENGCTSFLSLEGYTVASIEALLLALAEYLHNLYQWTQQQVKNGYAVRMCPRLIEDHARRLMLEYLQPKG